MTTYAAKQRSKLDAKITDLRAEGWDVVARRERDLAWSQRDDANDRIAELEAEVAKLRGQLASEKHHADRMHQAWLDEQG